MNTPRVYLDCNATIPAGPRVLEAMLPHLAVHYGNPSPDHVLGHHAKAAVARLSLGRFTTEREVDTAADAMIGAWKSLTA